jgi:hypothetical protein
MHRGVGDRTCVPEGAFTVAGLCRDLTGFATTRRDKDCRGQGTTEEEIEGPCPALPVLLG